MSSSAAAPFASPAELRLAIDALQERAENLSLAVEPSETYVDTSLLPTLLPLKNQIIYGRRGTGKTHLLLRLLEAYRDDFAEKRVLPLYVDGRRLKHMSLSSDPPGVALIIVYRRLLAEFIRSLRELLSEEVTLGVLDRIWPSDRKKRMDRINAQLQSLHDLARYGTPEPGIGSGHLLTKEAQEAFEHMSISLDARLRAEIEGLGAKLSLGASADSASTRTAEESLQVTYDALAVLSFGNIGTGMTQVLEDLDTEAVVILFDEWSAIDLDLQPALAEMIKSTLASQTRVVVKFACIPFHTRLEAIGDRGTLGYAVGEDVFVDADLDRLFSSYGNAGHASTFLLSVLHRHLGSQVESLRELTLEQAMPIFEGELFQDAKVISELVSSSAGIPRDFLRIFAQAYRSRAHELPIGYGRIRDAIHSFYTEEKTQRLNASDGRDRKLFDAIFKQICLASRTPFFFVSSDQAANPGLRRLWDQRLVHQLHSDYFAFADGQPGTYDVYVMDYGRFVSMRATQGGEQFARSLYSCLNALVITLGGTGSGAPEGFSKRQLAVGGLEEQFSNLMAGIDEVDTDLGHLLDDVGPLLADKLLT